MDPSAALMEVNDLIFCEKGALQPRQLVLDCRAMNGLMGRVGLAGEVAAGTDNGSRAVPCGIDAPRPWSEGPCGWGVPSPTLLLGPALWPCGWCAGGLERCSSSRRRSLRTISRSATSLASNSANASGV